MAGKKRPQSELLTWLRGQYDSHERSAKVAAREKRYAHAAEEQAMAAAYAFTVIHVEREARRVLDTLERIAPGPAPGWRRKANGDIVRDRKKKVR